MSFIRKAIIVNSSEFIALAIGLVQAIILSRVLGPAGIGQYSVITSAMMVTIQIFALGFPLSFLYHSQNSPNNIGEYLINTTYATALLGTIGGISLAILVHYQKAYFGIVPWFLLFSLFLYIPIHIQGFVTRNVLLIKIQARELSIMRILSILGSFLPIAILAAIGHLTVSISVLSSMFAALVMAVFGWTHAKKYLVLSPKPSFKLTLPLGLMGIRQGMMDLMVVVNGQISIIMVRFLLDDFQSVGYFTRGLQIAWLVVTSGQAIMPLLFSKWAAISNELLPSHVEKVMRTASTFVFIMIFLVFLTGKWLILLFYGKAFLPAVNPMLILLPGTVLYLLSNALLLLLASRGYPDISTGLLLLSSTFNFIFSWAFIHKIGIAGAALASALSNIILLLGLLFFVKNRFGIKIKKCLWLTKNDIKFILSSL